MNFASILRKLLSLKWLPLRRSSHLWFGAWGERAAGRYLRQRGYRVLVRDFDCPLGQIDLICLDRDTIVFVEVKTRVQSDREFPEKIVSQMQWSRIEMAAKAFLSRHQTQPCPCRFDLVIIDATDRKNPRFEHFENARTARVG